MTCVRSYKGILFPQTHFSAPTPEIKYKTSTPSTIDMAMQLLKADPRFVSIENVCDLAKSRKDQPEII